MQGLAGLRFLEMDPAFSEFNMLPTLHTQIQGSSFALNSEFTQTDPAIQKLICKKSLARQKMKPEDPF